MHILHHCSLIVCLKLGECSVLLFQGVLPVLGPLCFRWNLGISLSASVKKPLGFDQDFAQSLDQLEACSLLTILSAPVCVCGMSLHLLRSLKIPLSGAMILVNEKRPRFVGEGVSGCMRREA